MRAMPHSHLVGLGNTSQGSSGDRTVRTSPETWVSASCRPRCACTSMRCRSQSPWSAQTAQGLPCSLPGLRCHCLPLSLQLGLVRLGLHRRGDEAQAEGIWPRSPSQLPGN